MFLHLPFCNTIYASVCTGFCWLCDVYTVEYLSYRTWKWAHQSWWTYWTESLENVRHVCLDHVYCLSHTHHCVKFLGFFLVYLTVFRGSLQKRCTTWWFTRFLSFRWWPEDGWFQHWVLQEHGRSHGCILSVISRLFCVIQVVVWSCQWRHSGENTEQNTYINSWL